MECPKEILVMWNMVKETLKEQYSEPFCNLWYGNISPSSFDAATKTLVFDAKSAFITNELIEKHKTRLEEKFSEVCGLDLTIGFHNAAEDDPLVLPLEWRRVCRELLELQKGCEGPFGSSRG